MITWEQACPVERLHKSKHPPHPGRTYHPPIQQPIERLKKDFLSIDPTTGPDKGKLLQPLHVYRINGTRTRMAQQLNERVIRSALDGFLR